MGGGGLQPLGKKYEGLTKIICGCIRGTLIEQSRSRYSNRAVMVFFKRQCGKLLYAVIIRIYIANLVGGGNCCLQVMAFFWSST